MNIRTNGSLPADTADAPAILENLVQEAERVSASDIHLQMRDAMAEVSFRLDGVSAGERTAC